MSRKKKGEIVSVLAKSNKRLLVLTALLGFLFALESAFAKTEVLIWTLNEVASPIGTVNIEINGKWVGVSDRRGKFYTRLESGVYTMEAFIDGFQRAKRRIVLKDSPATTHIDMLMIEQDVDIEVSSLSSTTMKLNHDFQDFDIVLRRHNGEQVFIKKMEWVYLTDMNKNIMKDVRDYFMVHEGKLILNRSSAAIASLQKLLRSFRSMVRLNVRASVSNMLIPIADVERFFYIGRYKLKGKIETRTGKGYGKRTFRINYKPLRVIPHVPKLSYKIQTDKKGKFFLGNMPFGFYEAELLGSDFASRRLWNWNFRIFGDVEVVLIPSSLGDFRAKRESLVYRKRNDDPRFVNDGPRFAEAKVLRRREE